jgi:hypothetical protein
MLEKLNRKDREVLEEVVRQLVAGRTLTARGLAAELGWTWRRAQHGLEHAAELGLAVQVAGGWEIIKIVR